MQIRNYREHPFHLLGKDIKIAGMAGPHNNDSIDEVFISLRDEAHRTVMIGLHEENYSEEKAKEHGIDYHYIPVEDYAQAVSTDVYDNIYNILIKATEEGKQVSIHCGAGNGRTGVALSTLKLRELIEKQVMTNPAILDEASEKTEMIYVPWNNAEVPCSPLVKAAVESIRTERFPIDTENGIESVEAIEDVDVLHVYEQHLKNLIKTELSLPTSMHSEPVHQIPDVFSMANISILLAGDVNKAKEQLIEVANLMKQVVEPNPPEMKEASPPVEEKEEKKELQDGPDPNRPKQR